jgi:hypothetical protein
VVAVPENSALPNPTNSSAYFAFTLPEQKRADNTDSYYASHDCHGDPCFDAHSVIPLCGRGSSHLDFDQ